MLFIFREKVHSAPWVQDKQLWVCVSITVPSHKSGYGFGMVTATLSLSSTFFFSQVLIYSSYHHIPFKMFSAFSSFFDKDFSSCTRLRSTHCQYYSFHGSCSNGRDAAWSVFRVWVNSRSFLWLSAVLALLKFMRVLSLTSMRFDFQPVPQMSVRKLPVTAAKA